MGLRFTPGAAVTHPLGVKPEGNLFLVDDVFSVLVSKHQSLGRCFASLESDALILQVLGFLDGADLLALGCASKYMACFANHVDLWRDLFWAEGQPEKIIFGSSWKSTWMHAIRRPAKRIKPSPLRNVFSDTLYAPYRASGLATVVAPENIERVALGSLTAEIFSTQFETPNKPVIITGVCEDVDDFWGIESLVRRFASIDDPALTCGSVNMRMSDYAGYLRSELWRTDEAPYFVFDHPGFVKLISEERARGNNMSGWIFDLQKILSPDLYDLLEPPFRPEHAWLLVGSDGGSSKWHVDPNSTSAWNAVILGSKKWLLLPPHLGPPPGVECSGDGFAVRQPLTLTEWFEGFYAETKSRHGKNLVECVCGPGETVFVPRGWWHCVRNIGTTVAVTQNYVPESALSHVRQFLKRYPHCVSGIDTEFRPMFGKKFDEILRLKRPDLVLGQQDEEKRIACENNDACGSEPCSFWAAFETAGRSLSFVRDQNE